MPKIGPKKKKTKKVQKPKAPSKTTSKSYKLRIILFARDGNRCLKCGSKTNLTIDHVIPKSKGGSNSLDNYQTLCKCCNGKKGATYADYRNKINCIDL